MAGSLAPESGAGEADGTEPRDGGPCARFFASRGANFRILAICGASLYAVASRAAPPLDPRRSRAPAGRLAPREGTMGKRSRRQRGGTRFVKLGQTEMAGTHSTHNLGATSDGGSRYASIGHPGALEHSRG